MQCIECGKRGAKERPEWYVRDSGLLKNKRAWCEECYREIIRENENKK
jgi:hypothetical protein